ncbi:glycosyltransferase [Desulfatiferula olefinivorans]
MKIIFLSHMFPNKNKPLSSVFVAEKAKALCKRNSLKIIAPISFFPFKNEILPKKIDYFDGLEVLYPKYLSMPFFHIRWYSYYCALLLENIKNYIKISDIINVEWIYPDCFVANKFAKKYNKKVVITVHGNEALGYFESSGRRKKYIQSLREADHIICVSNDLKNKITYDYKILDHKISVIPNGIDIKKFHILNKDKALSKLSVEIPSDVKVCVCVARLSEEKDLHTLIKSISFIKKGLKLFIIGDGPLKKELQNFITSLRLWNSVCLVGPVPHDEIINWLNAADIFCMSSTREGCPVVIHEALACGVPVISSDVGGIPDIINNDKYGFLCEPMNAELLSKNIEIAINKEWNNKEISNYGLQFTWDKVAKEMEDVFKSLLSY